MKFAVYGTLRRGDANCHYLSDSELLGTIRLKGFEMYSLGAFPYIVKGKGGITVEVYEVLNPLAVHGMVRMETGAGYDVVEVETPLGKVWLFVMSKDNHSQATTEWKAPRILNGDWFEYLDQEERKFKNEYQKTQ